MKSISCLSTYMVTLQISNLQCHPVHACIENNILTLAANCNFCCVSCAWHCACSEVSCSAMSCSAITCSWAGSPSIPASPCPFNWKIMSFTSQSMMRGTADFFSHLDNRLLLLYHFPSMAMCHQWSSLFDYELLYHHMCLSKLPKGSNFPKFLQLKIIA